MGLGYDQKQGVIYLTRENSFKILEKELYNDQKNKCKK